jgi:hypothetical protein
LRNVLKVFIPCVLVFLFAVSAGFAAGLATSGYLVQEQSARNTGASLSTTTKIYWKNDNMRIETYSVEGVSIQIKDGPVVYQYIPEMKMAMKVTLPPGPQRSVKKFLETQMSLPSGGKKVGSAVVAGLKCNVFSVPAQKGTSRVYISSDPRFPFRMKGEANYNSLHQVSETKIIKLNSSVPDSMFKLPSGTKIQTQKALSPSIQPSPKGRSKRK